MLSTAGNERRFKELSYEFFYSLNAHKKNFTGLRLPGIIKYAHSHKMLKKNREASKDESKMEKTSEEVHT